MNEVQQNTDTKRTINTQHLKKVIEKNVILIQKKMIVILFLKTMLKMRISKFSII